MSLRVAVVGGGIGGLSAAFALQAAGADVTVFERGETVGGKARNHVVGAHAVPGGPTVLTMRAVFDRLLAQAGERLDSYVDLRPLPILAHHRWPDGSTLDLHQDVEASAAAISAFAGPQEADGYRRFVADAARVFSVVEAPFIRRPKPDLFAMARTAGPFGAHKIKPFDTLWSALGRHFKDPRLRQLFGRYATYCGSSPFLAPATLMLVAHVERAGVWEIDGGITALAAGLARALEAAGGAIACRTPVESILVEGETATGVIVEGRERRYDAVIVNADPAALGAGLFGPNVRRVASVVAPQDRSLSAVTISALAETAHPLHYHTVAFSDDYALEFEALVGKGRRPSRPTIYVCAPKSADEGLKAQPVLIVMNAPADGDRRAYDAKEIAECEDEALSSLERTGLSLTLTNPVYATPQTFAQMLPGTGGALYGRASHGWTASFQRPAIRTRTKGLYLAGGSVHPGPGVPMASLSGQMAAQCLMSDLGLRQTFGRAAIDGGILTA